MSGTSERKLGSGAGMSLLAGGNQIQYAWETMVSEEGGKLGLEFSGTALATHRGSPECCLHHWGWVVKGEGRQWSNHLLVGI